MKLEPCYFSGLTKPEGNAKNKAFICLNFKIFNPPYYFCRSDSWFLTYIISNTYFQNQSFEYHKLLRHCIYTHLVSTVFLSLGYLGKIPPFAINLHGRFVSRFSRLVWKHSSLRTLLCHSITLFVFNHSVLHSSSYLWEESQFKGPLYSQKVNTFWSLESCFSQEALAILPLSHILPPTREVYSKQMLTSASATCLLKSLAEPCLLGMN